MPEQTTDPYQEEIENALGKAAQDNRQLRLDKRNISIKLNTAVGRFQKCERVLRDLLEAADRLRITGYRGGHKSTWIEALGAARELLDRKPATDV